MSSPAASKRHLAFTPLLQEPAPLLFVLLLLLLLMLVPVLCLYLVFCPVRFLTPRAPFYPPRAKLADAPLGVHARTHAGSCLETGRRPRGRRSRALSRR